MPYRMRSDEEEVARMGDEYSTAAPASASLFQADASGGDYSHVPPGVTGMAPEPTASDTSFEGQGLPGMAPKSARLTGYERARARLEKQAEMERSPMGRIFSTIGRMGDAYQGKQVAPTAEEKLAALEQQQEAFELQKRKIQSDLTKSGIEMISKLQPIWDDLSTEQQDKIVNHLSSSARAASAGSNESELYTPDVMRQVMKQKGFGPAMMRDMALLDEDEKAEVAKESRKNKWSPTQTREYIKTLVGNKVEPFQKALISKLGLFVAAAKTDAGKPSNYQMPVTEFANAVRGQFEDPLQREAFDRMLADPKNERFLVDAGLQSPKAVEAQQKAAAEAPFKEKEPFPKTDLVWVAKTDEWTKYKKDNPKATIKTFDEIPEEDQKRMLLAGDKLREARDIKVRQAEAKATAEGNAAARQERTVAEVSPTMHAIDLDTGEEVTQSLLNSQLRTESKRYKLFNAADNNNYRAAKENAEYLKTYRMAVKQLPMKPGENLGNYIDYRVKTAVGDYHIGTTLKAMQALSLRFAGALQGSRSQLSDQDREAVLEMLPTAADTQGKATQKLDVLEKVFNTMEGVLTGRMKRSRLDELLAEHESLRVPGAVKRDKSVAPVPK